MQFPFIDIVVMGIPEFNMLEPKAGVCGEQEFMEAIETHDMVFMEYVDVIGDMGFGVAIAEDSVGYSFWVNIVKSSDGLKLGTLHSNIALELIKGITRLTLHA